MAKCVPVKLSDPRNTIVAVTDVFADLVGQDEPVETLRRAAAAYREARQAIMVTEANEADLLRLFHTLNESTAEIGALLQQFGVSLGVPPPGDG